MNREKTTEAFEKYVDPIFIIQNGLMWVAPKKFCERFDQYEYSLENYNDELWLRAGMCVELAEKIQKLLSFKKTYEVYAKKMKEIASNYDLDYIATDNAVKRMDEKLSSHAKLQFCFENYLKEISLNNNLEILACLMAIYKTIVDLKKSKNPALKSERVELSKWYRYVRFAFLEEEAVDIKDFSKFSLQELSEKLFDLITQCQYYIKNSTDERVLLADGQNMELEVLFVEEDNDYVDFKIGFEQEVRDWMIGKIHNRENNL